MDSDEYKYNWILIFEGEDFKYVKDKSKFITAKFESKQIKYAYLAAHAKVKETNMKHAKGKETNMEEVYWILAVSLAKLHFHMFALFQLFVTFKFIYLMYLGMDSIYSQKTVERHFQFF